MKKIDIYNHVMPTDYIELMKTHSKDGGMVKRMSNLRMLWDIEARVDMLKQWPDVQQIISLALPSPEVLGDANLSPHLARVANDGMAAIVSKRPDIFPAFVASIPANNIPAALEEMDRAVTQLDARGIQLTTSIDGRALDDPEFFPLFEHATRKHNIPIWLHPFRSAKRADYPSEEKSQYEIWQVLGWPFDTSVAMARLVFSGLYEKLPDMRIITHHCGAMIPFLAGRAETLWAQMGSRSTDGKEADVLKRLSRDPIDYFKMFYADTVLGGSSSALRCGLDFFSADKIVFASDSPFDPENGPMYIREGIRSIEALGLSEEDRTKIYSTNARKLLGFDR